MSTYNSSKMAEATKDKVPDSKAPENKEAPKSEEKKETAPAAEAKKEDETKFIQNVRSSHTALDRR
ncbi:MAG: hypothetical protein P4L10_12725 [Acidobacteriaceae bacterium]|nr:hypothetical protein [Acidobacteriaceae bacterium]